MGILIFFGTATIIYIVADKLTSKEILNSNKEFNSINLDLYKYDEIINVNISEEKLVLTIRQNSKYKILIYDLKNNKILNEINIDN